MASTDLLEELKLDNYYPGKLSFSEATKLRYKSQNGCPRQYGLEIVRKLLTFDSTAVASVTTEINKRLNKIDNKETDNKGQCVADGIKPSQRSNFRSRRLKDKAEQSQRKVHPMDLLVVVMNCCNDFLSQALVEKMFANKLSIPILLPDVKTGSYKLLLLALRSLVPEVQDQEREDSASLTDTLVDLKNPIVSFIRVGHLHRSKSKLVNELLSFNSFKTFFHRDCPNGSVKRLVSNGSIEAAWFQSEKATEEEFNCRFFTALNLRGDATDYPKQTQFLCQSSTLVVCMVDSFESFKELQENVLKDISLSQTKIIVCCISDKVHDQTFKLLGDPSDRNIIYAKMYDWKDEGKMSDVDFTAVLRETISEFFKPEHIGLHSNQLPTYANISRSGKNFGFQLDEDRIKYELKASADKFVDLILKQPQDCKPLILPLQGEPWEKIGKLEREQRGKSHDSNRDEYFIAEKETERQRQRQIQCRSLIQQNKITHTFSLQVHILQEQNLSYYLNCCKMKLDARSRVTISNIIKECKKQKQKTKPQQSNERESEVELSNMELKIANSAIGLEHIVREHGQMYEAAISEEIRMKQELKSAPLTPDIIRKFPTIVARLLLMGQPLELMDGDASNVPITWLKEVLNQVKLMTNNAKVFVLSIIGVQSSGKSTLLNALFGLQFPVSAGRCTRGIYCHLVPVDKGSLQVEFDFVLVVDTEGLGSSEFTGKTTFRDNELATFAIGLADATIINMKGENWAEMKNILQVVAYGLIRVRKTKAELELMPRCMFVHQNVPATDAEEKNRLGEEKQLMLLDETIKAAGSKEGFTEIKKFDDVIKYDPGSHSWFFPDLWNGKPPRARVSQDYTIKVKELSQYMMQMMKDNPSKLTISSFFLRMSDLWNAMLHNDFVLCYRNTHEILSVTILNDRIAHEVDGFKSLNKVKLKKICESVRSNKSIEILEAEKEKILRVVRAAVDKNFTDMKNTLRGIIDATDISAALKQKCEISLNALEIEELSRIEDETKKVISVHLRKLEYDSDQRVKDLKARLADLEKCIEELEKDKLNETEMKDFNGRWQLLIEDNKKLGDTRNKLVESEIKGTIRRSIKELNLKEEKQWVIVTVDELFKTPSVDKMPQVTESDIVHIHKQQRPTRWVMDFVYSKSYVHKANSNLYEAHKKWKLQFKKKRNLEFDASHLEQVMFEVSQLLGIPRKVQSEGLPGADETCLVLPPGFSFTRDYISRFVEFACHYTFNQSLENSKRFISLADPLADIDERYLRSISHCRQMTAEANTDAISKQIFDYAVKSVVSKLGEWIKTEVCKEENENPTFMSKRAFLKTILADLVQKTNSLADVKGGKQRIFKEYMLYVELAGTANSETFFLNMISKFLKEKLTKEFENATEANFQKMVENDVGKVVENARNALRNAETNCKGCGKEYIRIFKDYMDVTSEIDFRITTLDDFTEAVLHKIDNLYADFIRMGNSSFETLECIENRAAIRPLFEKIMGCREKCPFCLAPCSQSLQHHAGDHRANHYPLGVSGTIDIWGLFADTQVANGVYGEKHRKPRGLVLSTCQARVNVQKYKVWYRAYMFALHYTSFKNYEEEAGYENWDIPYSQDRNASLYWKWFMAQFGEELSEHHKALCPYIPKSWKNITWEEAHQSLAETCLNS